ncbi:MAG: hypothetical protein J5994_10940 [Ruminococcus sp.]|nr:hypothetical protein [Ruminococcus sp.]
MKYDITYSCGHTGTVELFGKSDDRHRRLEWLKENALCPECYKEQHKDDPVVVKVTPFGSVKGTGEPVFLTEICGNTRPHKGAIKNIGFEWDGICWHRKLYMSQLDDFENAVMQIGNVKLDDSYVNIRREMENLPDEAKELLAKFHAEWDEKKKGYVVPEKPALLSSGKRWNGKVYGKSGNFSVYLDGEKVNVSDAEADDLRRYLTAKGESEDIHEEMKGVLIMPAVRG